MRIAYMTACVPRVGENLVQVIQGGAPGMEIGEVRKDKKMQTGAETDSCV